MPCLCTTNTLRLFIRGVSQVDITSSTLRSAPKQWQKTAIRSFSSTRAIREPCSNSNASFVSNKDIPFDRSLPNAQKPAAGSKPSPQGSAEGENGRASDSQAGTESTFVRIARESPGGPPKDSTQEGGTKKYAPAVEIKPTIRILRKTKVDHTGFKLHYSSPPAPLPARESSPSPKPKTKSPDPIKGKEEWIPPPREHWQLDKAALKAKFPEGWKPLKRLSPDALAGIRALHAQDPAQYTTEVLANSFKISPEAIRRVLKSKWSPDAEEETDRQRRWFNRGKSIYARHAELGQKPPKKWRDLGIGKGKPEWMVRKRREREKQPLPALITTSRVRDAKHGPRGGEESLEDRIL